MYRWFTDPAERSVYPAIDHDLQSRILVASLRVAATRGGAGCRAVLLADLLRHASQEFVPLWDRHDVTGRTGDHKVIVHPQLGQIALECQLLFTSDHGQALLVFTATPGTEGHHKLQLLGVIGTQLLSPDETFTNQV